MSNLLNLNGRSGMSSKGSFGILAGSLIFYIIACKALWAIHRNAYPASTISGFYLDYFLSPAAIATYATRICGQNNKSK